MSYKIPTHVTRGRLTLDIQQGRITMRGLVLLVVFTLAVDFIPTNAQFTYSEYELFGCYDNSSSDLGFKQIKFERNITLKVCRDLCAAADNTYFAVSGGDECACFKDVLRNSQSTPPLVLSCYDDRAIRCSADQTQYCGSADAYLIYTVCPKSKYGTDCLSTCSCPSNQMCTYVGSCQPSSCYPGFGYVISAGCRACNYGSYGLKCVAECSSNCGAKCSSTCTASSCDRSTGECASCRQGKGLYCQESCPTGTFDNTCSQTCSARCNETKCDHQSGNCFSCKDSNKWGKRCDETCSPSCSTQTCNVNTGYCDDACKDGFYGQTCENTCSSSCSVRCDKSSGNCTSGCIDNKWGDLCEFECAGNCKDSCDQNNGTCTSCVDGWYGYLCDKSCPEECTRKKCAKQPTGCPKGCMQGNEDIACNETCSHKCKKCKKWTAEKPNIELYTGEGSKGVSSGMMINMQLDDGCSASADPIN